MKTPTTDRWRCRRESRPFHPEDVGYPVLAAAIVQQAVEDYRDACRMQRVEIRHSSKIIFSPDKVKYEVMRFLKSQWYGTLCDIKPERIIKKLKEEET